jgi:hypothetical protein
MEGDGTGGSGAEAPKGKGAEEGGCDRCDSGEGGEQIYRSELDEENEQLRQREDRESRAQTKKAYDEFWPGIDVSITRIGDLVGSTSGLTLEQAELRNRELRQACGLRFRTDYRTDPRTAAEKWEEAKLDCQLRSEYNITMENAFGEELFIYMEGGVVKFMHTDMGMESHTSYAAISLSDVVDLDSLCVCQSHHGDSPRPSIDGLLECIWALGDTPLEFQVVQAVQAFNDNLERDVGGAGGGGGGRGGGGVGGGGGGAEEGAEVAGDGGEGEEGAWKDGEVAADKLTPGGAQKGGANMPGDGTGGSGAEAKVEGVRVEPAQDESLPAVPCSPLPGECQRVYINVHRLWGWLSRVPERILYVYV